MIIRQNDGLRFNTLQGGKTIGTFSFTNGPRAEMYYCVAVGFDPFLKVSQTFVLPLHYSHHVSKGT